MNDKAVAPVIAAMLILAVVVTFFAAWNAYFVPSMKAQSEIGHLKEVETGMLRFSSDIESAATLQKSLQISETIPLGGGDCMFDPVKSGGMIRVQSEPESYLLVSVTNATVSSDKKVRLVNYSYQPVNNFWQDQGYVWSHGNVNVTKGTLATPLQYYQMKNVTYPVVDSLFDLNPDSVYCNVITVNIVNMSPAEGHAAASGNGNSQLFIRSTIAPERITNVTGMDILVNPHLGGFGDSLWNSVSHQATTRVTCGNVHVTTDPGNRKVHLAFDPIPNMTILRQNTDLNIGAR